MNKEIILQVTDELLNACGGSKYLFLGDDKGGLVRSLLSMGMDAYGLTSTKKDAETNNISMPNRFQYSEVTSFPYEDNAFDTVVITDYLERINSKDLPKVLSEIHRVCRRSIYLKISNFSEYGDILETIQDRRAWEMIFFNQGFRKHPSYYLINSYESLGREGNEFVILLEKIPAHALERYPLEALKEERDLHMDMTREAGERSDAHIARYQWAATFVRPGDTVLDAACGLGYGSYLIQCGTIAAQTIGIDGSDYAVDYATKNFSQSVSNLSFRVGMLPEALDSIPDHSVDLVISFETLEHVPDPEALLAAFYRVLTPAGRVIVSVPNDWSDETGEDPNPFHLHIYDLNKLRDQINIKFDLEQVAVQSATHFKSGLGSKEWLPAKRELYNVATDIDASSAPCAEWWLAVGMRPVTEGKDVPYKESQFKNFDNKNWNVTNFARDYENPWLVRGLVDIGHRVKDASLLKMRAEEIYNTTAEVCSADKGAALCVLGYQLLNSETISISQLNDFQEKVDEFTHTEPPSPHALRWQVSLQFLAGKLWLNAGEQNKAKQALQECININSLEFSPLLANRTVESFLMLGVLSLVDGNKAQASDFWRKGIHFARDAVTHDWNMSLGEVDNPVEFGLPELASILDYASSCAYGLVNIDVFADKPWWWLQIRRNRNAQFTMLERKANKLHFLGEEVNRLNEVINMKDNAFNNADSLKTQLLNESKIAHEQKDSIIKDLEKLIENNKDELSELLKININTTGGIEKEFHERDEIIDELKKNLHDLNRKELIIEEFTEKLKDSNRKDQEISELMEKLKDLNQKEMAIKDLTDKLKELDEKDQLIDELHKKLQDSDVKDQLIQDLNTKLKDLHIKDELIQTLNDKLQDLHTKDQLIHELSGRLRELDHKDMLIKELTDKVSHLNFQQNSRLSRLSRVAAQPWSIRKAAHLAYLLTSLATPLTVRRKLAPLVAVLREKYSKRPQTFPVVSEKCEETGYMVNVPLAHDNAPKVVHVIANFMTGGSSRLVVDLIEYLGDKYQQAIITSFIPDPPAYRGINIEECRFPVDSAPFIEYLKRHAPDFVHVHYWGDVDEPWYAKAIEAAKILGIPVIENINTPIAPHMSEAVKRYVYVSDYVKHVFGQNSTEHTTIYPGSDFSRFMRSELEVVPKDCLGMVYRLEGDKLNADSILPFIKTVQKRPQTKVLIVGGGTLLEPFQKAVEEAGLQANFEFTGYVSYDDLPNYYRRMTLFVAPVWKESFGQVSPFAMNMRVPVIGYDVGAISEIVNSKEMLAPAADADALADIAIKLLDNDSLRNELGKQHQVRAKENFSVQAMINAYDNLYGEVVSEKVK